MSLILSIFCPLCESPYDATSKRPRLGKCRHTICQLCIKNREGDTCPLCEKENAFSEILYNFELEKWLPTMKEQSTEEALEKLSLNPVKLHYGTCSGLAREHIEKLRLCLTCAENLGVLKKLKNGKTQLIEPRKMLHLAKLAFFCASCILDEPPDHVDHKYVKLEEVDMVEMDLEFWNYVIHALFLERSLNEKQLGVVIQNDGSNVFRKIILSSEQEKIRWNLICKHKKYLNPLEDHFKLRLIRYVDIYSIPELAELKDASYEKAKKIIDRISKVRERLLWTKKAELDYYLKMMATINLECQDEEWLEFKAKIPSLATQFRELHVTDLSFLEGVKLDVEMDKKLTTYMKKFEFFDSEDPKKSKFFIYKAIRQIMEDAQDKKLSMEMDEEIKKFVDFFNKRHFELEESISSDSLEDQLAHRLFLFELTERSLKIDKLWCQSLELMFQFLEGQVLWQRYFPDAVVYFDQDQHLYSRLLSERFLTEEDGDKNLIEALFSVSMAC